MRPKLNLITLLLKILMGGGLWKGIIKARRPDIEGLITAELSDI